MYCDTEEMFCLYDDTCLCKTVNYWLYTVVSELEMKRLLTFRGSSFFSRDKALLGNSHCTAAGSILILHKEE